MGNWFVGTYCHGYLVYGDVLPWVTGLWGRTSMSNWFVALQHKTFSLSNVGGDVHSWSRVTNEIH